MAKARLAYKGAPVSNTLGSSLAANATSISLASAMVGWPTGTNPFFVVVDAGTSKEEKICVIYNSTTSLTVVDPAVTSGWSSSVNGRGADDTTDRAHDAGAPIYPVFTAREANQANELASAYTANGDIVVHGSSSFKKIAVGTNNYALLADSSVTDGGVKWGQIVEASIATGAVTSAKIADATIAAGDLAAATKKLLCPVGTISAYGGATAPSGWLLCNGDAIDAGYTELIALVGANTPDMKGRVPMGKTASPGTGSTLLGTGGNRKIASNHLPTHAHALDHDHASFNYTHDHGAFTVSGGDHSHNYQVSGVLGGNPVDPSYVYAGGTGETFATESAGHSHSIDVPSHTGSIDVPAFTGTVTTTFANDDYFQPFVAVNYIIKHDY